MINVVVVTGVSDASAIDGEVAGTSGMLVAVEDASLIMTLVIVFGAGILETAGRRITHRETIHRA